MLANHDAVKLANVSLLCLWEGMASPLDSTGRQFATG